MMAKLIAYECEAPAHQPSLMHPDKLTIHGHEWAFCPFDARADGHRWKQTGGIDLESLTRRFGLPTVTAPTEAPAGH